MSAIDDLIQQLGKLPGIGERTATRLAFHLLRSPLAYRRSFAEALQNLERVHLCSSCCTVTEQDPCAICRSPIRQTNMLCVVEKPSDIYSIERLQSYRGLYHVLHGLLSPMDGIGPRELKMTQLFDRLRPYSSYQSTNQSVGQTSHQMPHQAPQEIILALSPTVEGDATAQYIVKQINRPEIEITKLASGIAVGSDLEFADQITLGKAFEARTRLR